MRSLEIENDDSQPFPRFHYLDEAIQRLTNNSSSVDHDIENRPSTQFFYDGQQGNNESALLLKTLQSMDQRGQNSMMIEETFIQKAKPMPKN